MAMRCGSRILKSRNSDLLHSGITRELPDGRVGIYAWFSAMHTRVDLLLNVDGGRRDELPYLVGKVRGLISDIEAEGNCFDNSSLLARFNNQPSGSTVPGGKYLYEMFSLCQRYHVLTRGLFDITVETAGHIPDMIRTIDLSHQGYIVKRDGRVYVDLSGFIKGYALDCIRTMLNRNGVHDAVVNMGNSSILAIGDVPMRMKRSCLTTSGNASGKPKQIVDPRSNRLVTRDGVVRMATDSGAEGEALATAYFVAGPRSVDEVALSEQFPGVVVSREP